MLKSLHSASASESKQRVFKSQLQAEGAPQLAQPVSAVQDRADLVSVVQADPAVSAAQAAPVVNAVQAAQAAVRGNLAAQSRGLALHRPPRDRLRNSDVGEPRKSGDSRTIPARESGAIS